MRAAAATLTLTSGLALAGVAGAATPQQVYADAARNGHLVRSYSKADLSRARHDATLAGYGNQIVKITVKSKQKPKPPPSQVFKPPRSALPFTGSELTTYLALGVVLMAGGFLLRMMTGDRSGYR